MSDPFAVEPDVADEAQQQTPDPAPEPAKPATSRISVESDHFPIKVTLKGGPGYDAPWLTHDFRSVEEADQILNGPDGARLAGVLTRVQAVAEFFVSKNSTPKTARSGGGSSAPTADSAPAWMGSAPSCDHGTKKYVTKLRGDGSRWHAWGCNGTKDNQCEKGLDFKNPPK